MNNLKARRRFHRAFLKWLQSNQCRFVTPPFYLIKRTDRFILFTIKGLNPALSFGMSTWKLGVHVTWQGEYWDTLIYFESSPKAVPDGYICKLCQPAYQKIYPNRETLWHEHDFEAFREWVNTELAEKNWLSFNGNLNSCTWVELRSEPEPKAAFNVPIWDAKK